MKKKISHVVLHRNSLSEIGLLSNSGNYIVPCSLAKLEGGLLLFSNIIYSENVATFTVILMNTLYMLFYS